MIGIGGVETVDDVIEFLLAGASAVQVGTALFRDPRTAENLVDGLAARLVEMKVERVSELVGGVRPWRESMRRDQRRSQRAGLERVAVALDTDDRATFERWCALFGPRVGVLKVGLEAFVRWGPPAIETARRHARALFLDLKLHDIPNTVAGAVRSARELGVDYLTIHAAGGPAMIAAAAEAADGQSGAPRGDRADPSRRADARARSTCPGGSSRRALLWARIAREAGAAGVVCSPLELARLRPLHPAPFRLVTPGIRPAGGASDDQRRTATAAAALAAGADLLVVGRPLTQAADPERRSRLRRRARRNQKMKIGRSTWRSNDHS